MTVPNAITGLRLLLVPVFAALHLAGHDGAALLVFVVAAVSDGIDGMLARLLDQRTELGALLDPLADKLLGFVALVLLVAAGAIPVWLLGLALLRDVIVLGVGLAAKLEHRLLRIEPTRVSKYATFLEMVLVTLALVERASGEAELHAFVAAVGLLTAQCLVVACGQYLLRGRRLLAGGAPG